MYRDFLISIKLILSVDARKIELFVAQWFLLRKNLHGKQKPLWGLCLSWCFCLESSGRLCFGDVEISGLATQQLYSDGFTLHQRKCQACHMTALDLGWKKIRRLCFIPRSPLKIRQQYLDDNLGENLFGKEQSTRSDRWHIRLVTRDEFSQRETELAKKSHCLPWWAQSFSELVSGT